MADEATSVLSYLVTVFNEIVYSPINLALLCVCGFLVYKFILKSDSEKQPKRKPSLPKMKRQDFTLEQLKEYDGKTNPEGRILIAVAGKVFDVTRGKQHYGPDGPYHVFAGHDASRGLATFSLTSDSIRDEYDDLSDLNAMQMESVSEWEMQFTEKYDLVGRLLRSGEEATEYSDSEGEVTADGEKVRGT